MPRRSRELFIPSWLCVAVNGWVLQQDCVSASLNIFDVGFISIAQCVGVTQQVSGCLSERIVSYADIDAVCPWAEVSSEAFYITKW